MKLHLVDTKDRVTHAWRRHFDPFPEVEILTGNILKIAKHAIVSPANSHGFMDGGIDLQYLNFFGLKIQDRVQEAIARRSNSLLPVGAALAVPTDHSTIPWLIVAPTMEMPGEVPPINANRTLRAIFRLIRDNPHLNGDIYCPGLATGIGRVSPDDAAREMASAFADWADKPPLIHLSP